MLSTKRLHVPCLAVLVVSGCMGSSFSRQDDGKFVLGHTTYTQVIAEMGPPLSTQSGEARDPRREEFEIAHYESSAYFEEPGNRQDTYATSIQDYIFYKDVLVGRAFVSSNEKDSLNWNKFKVDDLVKGRTTRSEVIKMLGRPSAAFIWPAVAKTSGEAVGYYHCSMVVSQSWVAMNKATAQRHRKQLLITFDDNDRIADVEYERQDDELSLAPVELTFSSAKSRWWCQLHFTVNDLGYF